MDKAGWGLALDSCPSPTLPFFHPSSSSSSSSKQPHTPSVKPFSSYNNERMFPLLGFPVNLTRPTTKEEQDHLAAHHDEHQQHDNNNRKVVGEVDFFFSDRNKTTSSPPPPPTGHHHHPIMPNIVSVKKENIHHDEISLNLNTGLQLLTANTGSDQSTVDDGVSSDDAEDKRAKSTELAMLQVELQRMNAENQKLKEMLSHVSGNYTALQMHLATLMQHHRTTDPTQNEGKSEEKKPDVIGGVMAPTQFLDLVPVSAGTTAEVDDQVSNSSSDERTRSSTPQNNNINKVMIRNNNGKNEMGHREESPDSESQGWGPNKHQKLNPSNAMDQSSSESTMRKARVSVRARSEAPMISDGCQWRKYGQKMAKGNPCPRAYYRCTMAVGCPVRKQVQRCAEDRTILVTTYEGTHNHPLPPAAMAMASTTSAAASMLLSGSMSSADGIMNPNLLARAILPCSSSMATLSASAPFPTVTLDLTHNNPTSSNPLQAQIRPPTHHPNPLFQVPFQGHPQNFGAVSGVGGGVSAGSGLYNQSRFSGLQLSQEMGSSQLAIQSSRPPLQQNQQLQPSLADSVTAAITTDPNFTAVLAAAISSIIGSGAQPNNSDNNNNTNSNVTNKTSATMSNLSGK